MRYQWETPFEWLKEASEKWTPGELRAAFLDLALRLDSDDIQDIHQTEMDQDGYFADLDAQDEDTDE